MSLFKWFAKPRSFRKVGGFDDGETRCIQITADGYRRVPIKGKASPWTPDAVHFTLANAEGWVAQGLWEELP